MRVIVTGGTGFVGRPLVRRLMANGAEVTVLTRSLAHAQGILPTATRLIVWDPQKPLEPSALRGADAVINLAGEGIAEGRWTEARKRAIRDSRVHATRGLVNAMKTLPENTRPRALISASAIGYYGDRGDEELSEPATVGSDFLADVCLSWESEAHAAAAFGVRVVTMRTGVVLGPDGGALAKMLPPFRLGAGGRLGSGKQWMSWIHLDDLVGLYLWALDNESVRGAVNATAPVPLRNRDFTKALARVLKRPAIVPVPAAALRLAFGEMASVLLASQRVRPDVARKYGFDFRFKTVDVALEDILKDLDHELIYEQWLPAPPEQVFSFFSDPHNLEQITPAFLGFSVLGMSTDEMQEGTLINYRLKLRGIPVKWQSRIESWEPPRRFVDRQTKGPYGSWVHTHEFEPHAGGTLVRDHVRYSLPLGALGEIAASGWVAKDVAEIFAFRRATLARMFPHERAVTGGIAHDMVESEAPLA